MKNVIKVTLAGVSALALVACQETYTTNSSGSEGSSGLGNVQVVNLAPSTWPAADQEKFWNVEETKFPGNPLAVGYGGAVSGSYHGMAQRAGLEALKQGGSSVDAAMTTALTQIALGGGAVISYFGIMTLVHYDAATGEVTYMNAGWDTVKGETEPMTIPGAIGGSGDALYGSGLPSGRTALVGGFMRGVESAHARYGKLPFESLFTPSIEIAEKGVPFTDKMMSYLEPRKNDLARLPASKAVFSKENGEWLEKGDLFRQPALASTLRKISTDGVNYMYTGDWAEKAVAAVQADGGKMTMEDLAKYEVQWNDPIKADFENGYTIYGNGLPSYGGVNMIEAQHLGRAAEIKELGHWSESAESFKRMSHLLSMSSVPFIEAMAPGMLEGIFKGAKFDAESRLTRENADKIWETMKHGASLNQYADGTYKHSDTVVAVDKWGNMTAVVHSINCVVWGKTAIIVDGVTIGDPAVSQKAIVAAAGPGNRLPDPTEAGLVFKDGKPVLTFSSMAMGLHLETFQSLMNYTQFGMNPKEALDAPSMLSNELNGDLGNPASIKSYVRVMEGDFPDEVLSGSGLPIKTVKPAGRRYSQGLWVAIERDPDTGEMRAASHPYTNGQALALEK